MAGIPGQPGTKPSQLQSPVPGEDAFAELDSISSDSFAELDALDSTEMSMQADAGGGYDGFGSDTLATVADWLPAVGGLAGGIAGAVAGAPTGPGAVASAVGGAALGAAGGEGWKQVILQDVLKRVPPQGALERTKDIGGEAAMSAAGSLVGLGVSKGVATAASSRWGKALTSKVADMAAKPLAAVREKITQELDEIYKPVAEILARKVTPLTQEEAGAAIKNQLGTDIKKRFAGFVNAYQNLDDVAANVPLRAYVGDTGKVVVKNPVTAFTDAVRNEALDQPKATYGLMKQYTDRFDQVTNGREFTAVLSDLRKAAEKASADAVKYNSNIVRDRAAALMKFADDADAFYEDKVIGGIAKRVATGKATPTEIEGFQRMMAAQSNPNVPLDPNNLQRYTRTVATDYLKQKETVKANYAQFRGLLEDISDVTKVSTKRMGPRQFERALSEVPPDLLAERAFDPKNAVALRTLAKEYPQTYDMIVRNKMSDIIAKNMDLDGTINYKGIARTLTDMPDSSSRLLMNSAEYQQLLKVVNDPRIELIAAEQAGIANKVALSLARIGELTRQTGKAARPSPLLPKTSAATGQMTARGLSAVFGSGE